MQELKFDGSQVLTDRVTTEEILTALGDPSNKVVAIHKPGSVVTLLNSWQYVAQADGSWKRLRT